jgi:hypothetical protein
VSAFDRAPRVHHTNPRGRRAAELGERAETYLVWAVLGAVVTVGCLLAVGHAYFPVGLTCYYVVRGLQCAGRAAYLEAQIETERRDHLARIKGMS